MAVIVCMYEFALRIHGKVSHHYCLSFPFCTFIFTHTLTLHPPVHEAHIGKITHLISPRRVGAVSQVFSVTGHATRLFAAQCLRSHLLSALPSLPPSCPLVHYHRECWTKVSGIVNLQSRNPNPRHVICQENL